MQGSNQIIQNAQSQLLTRFRLNKKEVNEHIYKMNESKKERGFMTAKDSLNDKKIKTRSDLISTSSSMKCSIRIRKSKKVM